MRCAAAGRAARLVVEQIVGGRHAVGDDNGRVVVTRAELHAEGGELRADPAQIVVGLLARLGAGGRFRRHRNERLIVELEFLPLHGLAQVQRHQHARHRAVAPASTPKPIVERLAAEMKKIMTAPDMQKKIADLGLLPLDPPSLSATDAYLASERKKWGAVVRSLGLEGSQ